MIGRLLQKILPKRKPKEQVPLTERELNGRNNVGYPTMQLSGEIDDLVYKYYRSLRPAIKFYKESLLFKSGPSLIEISLSDDQLKQLSGRNVQMVYLLLFRDMLRHIAPFIALKNAHDHWTDTLCQEILENCQMLGDKDDKDVSEKKKLFDESPMFNIEDEATADWVILLAALVQLPADKLYQIHQSLVSVMLKRLDKSKKNK